MENNLFDLCLSNHLKTFNDLGKNKQSIINAAKLVVEKLNDNKIIFTCGNGGSASDAQHLSAEIVGRFEIERRSLPSICLNTDTSVLTAISNDYGYENVFSRQISGIASRGDVLFAISTSGQSPNIRAAILTAIENDMDVILLTSAKFDWEFITKKSNVIIVKVPSVKTAHIQEAHIFLIHYICKIIDEAYSK